MAGIPSSAEWDTSLLPGSRRAYLDSGRSFEEIARSGAVEAKVLKLWSERYRDRPKNVSNGARQVCFRVQVSKQTYDLLYNAPDGIRGRYWQDPCAGDLATRSLISCLEPILLGFAERNPSVGAASDVIGLQEVCASLRAKSAKVWVREKDDAGNTKIAPNSGPQLKVHRWEQNEALIGSKGPLWRWTPCDDEIEIKGAILDAMGMEHIPEIKRDRSLQIHQYGFT